MKDLFKIIVVQYLNKIKVIESHIHKREMYPLKPPARHNALKIS